MPNVSPDDALVTRGGDAWLIDPLLPEVVAALGEPGARARGAAGRGQDDAGAAGAARRGPGGDGRDRGARAAAAGGAAGGARGSPRSSARRSGETVGYQVRFEDVVGPRTRLRFVTEGMLTRRLSRDPTLPGVGAVVLDEFHERHLARRPGAGAAAAAAARPRGRTCARGDVGDARRRAGRARSSAAARGCAPRGGASRSRSSTSPQPDDRPLERAGRGAVRGWSPTGSTATCWCSCRARRRSAARARRCDRGRGAPPARAHAAARRSARRPSRTARSRPGERRKVILSTNVAETSVTIDGVRAVIDSGLARVAGALAVVRAADAASSRRSAGPSATQRAGRAGRTRAGRCLRLYTRHDFDGRPAHDAPEVRRDRSRRGRARAARARRARPRAPSLVRGAAAPRRSRPPSELLVRLGAVDAAGALTDARRGCCASRCTRGWRGCSSRPSGAASPREGAILAALLGERDIRHRDPRPRWHGRRRPARALSGPSDLLELLERFRSRRGRLQRRRCGSASSGRVPGGRAGAQAAGAPARTRRPGRPRWSRAKQALLLAVLAGYPDRVAKRRRPKAPELVLSAAGRPRSPRPAWCTTPSCWSPSTRRSARRGGWSVRLASAGRARVAARAVPRRDQRARRAEVERDHRAGRARHPAGLRNVVLEETREPGAALRGGGAGAGRGGARRRAREVRRRRGARALSRPGWTFAREAFPEAGFRSSTTPSCPRADGACVGLTSFDELRESWTLDRCCEQPHARAGAAAARPVPRAGRPARRARVTVNYERGKPPWIESRLQDFFGMAQGPRVGGGQGAAGAAPAGAEPARGAGDHGPRRLLGSPLPGHPQGADAQVPAPPVAGRRPQRRAATPQTPAPSAEVAGRGLKSPPSARNPRA